MSQDRTTGGDALPTGDWLTLGQAATYLGVAQSTIRKWSDAGQVPTFYTPGGHRRYRRDDLAAFLSRSGAQRRASGPIVLVVDDDEGVRALLRVTLEQEGYRVREAAGARNGLEALAGEAPDLVLLDVMMPEMDGWEMLQQVQRRHGRAVPVIMFSGSVDESALAAESRGASGFVGKPFDPQQLLEQARRILSR